LEKEKRQKEVKFLRKKRRWTAVTSQGNRTRENGPYKVVERLRKCNLHQIMLSAKEKSIINPNTQLMDFIHISNQGYL